MNEALFPPHDFEAERAVIGASLIDQLAFEEAADVVKASDFYSGANVHIFDAMCAVHAAGRPIDIQTVASRLRDTQRLAQVGNFSALTELLNATPNIRNVVAYAETVRMKAILRQCLVATQRAQAALYNGAEGGLAIVDAMMDECTKALDARRADGAVKASEAYETYLQSIDDSWEGKESGVLSGYPNLDLQLGSLRPQEITLVAARPGCGKTSLVGEMAMNAAKAHAVDGVSTGILFLSLEMPKAQILGRLACSAAGVDMTAVRIKGAIQERVRLENVRALIREADFLIDDAPGKSLSEVRAGIRCAKRDFAKEGKRLKLVIIDYLQLMRGDGKSHSREQEVAFISRGLKELAKTFEVHIVALSQINRGTEGRDDKRPTLGDLRESGALEQDADNVIALYRESYYDPEKLKERLCPTEVILLKQRNGKTGTVVLNFEPTYTRFSNASKEQVASYFETQKR